MQSKIMGFSLIVLYLTSVVSHCQTDQVSLLDAVMGYFVGYCAAATIVEN